MTAGNFTGFRRRLRIDPRPGRCEVALEDDCHHFEMAVAHDGATILRLEPGTPRVPWTSCALAADLIATRMQGVALADVGRVEDQRQHCTHLYDLAVIGARHASESAPTLYDIRVGDRIAGVKLAEIDRDGVPLLVWRHGDTGATATDPVPGGANYAAMEAWSIGLPPELHEAARMLRRGVMVSWGRKMDFPAGAPATVVGVVGNCFTFQPDRAPTGKRIPDTRREFSDRPDALLSRAS